MFRIRLVVTVAIGALAIAACGSSTSADSTSPVASSASEQTEAAGKKIQIVDIIGATGATSSVAALTVPGVQLAVDEINSSGYLGDSQIELTVQDSGSDPQQASALFTQAANDPNILGAIGPVYSLEALSVGPLAMRYKLPTIFTQAGSPGVVSGEYTYRATAPFSTLYPVLFDKLAADGVKTIGLLYDSANPNLTDIGESVIPALAKSAGIEVVASVGVPTSTIDYSAPLGKIVDADPDAVGVLLVTKSNGTGIQQLRNLGYEGTIFSSPSAGSGNAGPAGKGVIWPTDFNTAQPGSGTETFNKLFMGANNGETPSNYAAEGYDAMWMMARGIKAAGELTREGLQAGLDKVAAEGFEGAMGPLTFDNRDLRVPGVVVQWDGTKEILVD